MGESELLKASIPEFSEAAKAVVLGDDWPTTYQRLQCNADLYGIVDTITQWMLSDKCRDPRSVPIDLNGACGLLTGIDEGWLYKNMTTRMEVVAAQWNAWKLGLQDDSRELFKAIDDLVGVHVTVSQWSGDPVERRIDLLKKSRQGHVEAIQAIDGALKVIEETP